MINIEPATPAHQTGGLLTHYAIDDMAPIILGEEANKQIANDLQYLWALPGNRFSHDISYVAVENGDVLGAMTCAPLATVEQRLSTTVWHIIKRKKFKPFLSILRHPLKFKSLVTMDEGNEDEFHIAMLATMPEARGKGVAQQLLDFAENEALQQGFNKISLTVVQSNTPAYTLYKKQGYQVVGSITNKPFYLFQMRKLLSS